MNDYRRMPVGCFPGWPSRWREQRPSAYFQWKALVAQETMVSAPMTVVMMVQMALMMTRQWSLVILPIVM